MDSKKFRDKDYQNAYRKVLRIRNKIDELTAQIEDLTKPQYTKVGGKTVNIRTYRSELYAELTEANEQLAKISRSKGFKTRKRERVYKKSKKKIKFKTSEGIKIDEGWTVWQAEGRLREVLKEKMFKIVIIANTNQKFYVKKTSANKILYEFDFARNLAYQKQGASTPVVDITENHREDSIMFEIFS